VEKPGRVIIRFTIEQRHLTDSAGKPVPETAPDVVVFANVDAESVDDAVRLYVKDEHAEVIGDILRFPGFQAVATVRSERGVYTLQITPASGRLTLR
jgi:hypothetical protein